MLFVIVDPIDFDSRDLNFATIIKVWLFFPFFIQFFHKTYCSILLMGVEYLSVVVINGLTPGVN